MVSAAEFNFFISVMSWLAIGILGLAMATMVLLLSVRIHVIARRKRIGRLVSRWRTIFIETRSGRSHHTVGRGDAFTVLNLWNDFCRVSETGSEIANDSLARVARANGFDQLAMRLVRKDAGNRLVALTTIGYMRLAQALDQVILHTKDPLGEISLAAYRALVLIDSEQIDAFAQALLEHSEWRPRTVEHVLKELGPRAIAAPFARAAADASDGQLPGLLMYFTLCDANKIRPALLDLLRCRSNADVLAAALRALVPIARAQDRLQVRGFLHHPKSFVRIAAIAALAPLITEDDRPDIKGLLGDENSWVRYRAAEALLSSFAREGDDGFERELTDRFARDALKQVLAERSVIASQTEVAVPSAQSLNQRAIARRPMDELRA